MDRLCDSLEQVSCGSEVSVDKDCIKNSKLCLEFISTLEYQLEEYEKVSISFLFFDDIDTCFKICQKCIHCPHYSFLSENSVESSINWSEKLLECLVHIQNILLLNKLGISKYDAERYFITPRAVSKQRILFYKICENLSNEETAKVMNIPSVPSQKYAEIYILSILSNEKYLKSFLVSLSSLKNSIISYYVKKLSKYFCFEGIDKSIAHLKDVSKHIEVNSEKIYPIKDPNNVGLCFIINEVNFKDQSIREGSSVDVTLIESTMKYFNFEVKTFTDVTKQFFTNDLNKNIKEYFKNNHSAFFMFILSHGIQGAIYCSDDEPVTIDYIIMKLSCKNLLKIPKVLIIQACQGNNFLLKDKDVTDGPHAVGLDQPSKKTCRPTYAEHNISDFSQVMSTVPGFRTIRNLSENFTDEPKAVGSDQPSKNTRNPTYAEHYISDFLQVMSTVPGFRTIRNLREGTWFIQSLCKCWRENENDCIFSIITQTIKRVKDRSLPTKINEDVGQHPEMRSLFEKKLYLKPCISD